MLHIENGNGELIFTIKENHILLLNQMFHYILIGIIL